MHVNARDHEGAKDTKPKIDSIPLSGYVYDRLTSHHLIGVKVEILNADSSLVSTARGGQRDFKYDRDKGTIKDDSISRYEVYIPRVKGEYFIHVSKPGYESLYIPYSLENLKKRDSELHAPNIYMSREKIRTLEEFTVKASKVMFYHKGDTIVYNADAFILPEGSMLDALVKQMPGVEIRGDKIYVNGRFVETLLLNGKDFFKGNQNVLLENIGAYAVRNVAVYEKKDEMSYILGSREDVTKEYVMDVRLKKDHMAGNMINTEIGGGTKSRYIGRLFAMHYTNNSRLSLYGNANNINQNNRLGENSWEIHTDDEKGVTERANGGFDYLVDNPLHTWEVNGNVDVHRKDNHNNVVTNAIKFLQSGDAYDYSATNSRLQTLSVSTFHNLKIKKDNWNLNIKPQFSYNKDESDNETVSASFDKEHQGLDPDIVRDIYSGSYRDLQTSIINRNLKTYESNTHGYEAQLYGESKIKMPDSPDAIEMKFTAGYDRKSLFGNTLQDICFGAVPATSLLQKRFQSDRPQYNFKLQGLARYYFNIPVGNLNASYEYIHSQNRKNSDITLLEAIAENSMAEFAPDDVPMPDFANSYTSKLYKNQHILKVTWNYKKKSQSGTLELQFEPKFFAERHDLFYHRGETDANPRRGFLRFNIENCLLDWASKNKRLNLRFNYRLKQNVPNMISMVDILNTTDPMNIWTGNPDLKKSTLHQINALLSIGNRDVLTNTFNFNTNINENSLVTGYRYDSNSGVRTMRTYNISGIYNLSLRYSIMYKFGSSKQFQVRNYLNGGLNNYADMIGYDQEPERQVVRSYTLSDSFMLSYRIPKFVAELHAGASLNNTHSESLLMSKLNSGMINTTMYCWVRLPLGFSFSTSMNIHKRYGYIDNSMNRTYLNWNAELRYTIDKGKWIFKLEAKDILNQYKGVDYSVDATGRTQTLNTVLPRYLMLSVHYRFDFKPNRK